MAWKLKFTPFEKQLHFVKDVVTSIAREFLLLEDSYFLLDETDAHRILIE